MSETLVDRVKRLVSGGLNSLVDAVENATPETVMDESIREIDGAIDSVRHELGRIVASKHLASKRLIAAGARHEELAAQIELAVAEDKDDLAEAAIARQLDLEAQMPVLESAIKDAGAEERELESYIRALQARRREMEDERAALKGGQSDTRPRRDGDAPFHATSSRAEQAATGAERAFNRALREVTGLPGMNATDRDTAGRIAELEKLARDNRIHERLAEVKALHQNEDK